MSVLLPLKNCKQMFWGHVKTLQSVDKLLIHWWFLLDNQHQKSAGKNSNIHSILTTYNTHMIYNEIWRGENGHCPKVWTAVYSHALKAVHQIMPGGGGGVWEGGWWVADHPLRCFIQMRTIGRMVVMYTMLGIVGYLLLWNILALFPALKINAIKWGGSRTKRLECWIYSSLVRHM